MERKIILIILILFGFHLLYSNTMLLMEANLLQSAKFWTSMPEYMQYTVTIFFAGSYSAITVLMLELYPRTWLIISLATLDFSGVFIKYAPIQEYFAILAAVYFAIYTGMIVISIGMYQLHKNNVQYESNNENNTNNNTTGEAVIDNNNGNIRNNEKSNGILSKLSDEDREIIESKQKNKDIAYAVQKIIRKEKSVREVAKELSTSPNKVQKIKKMFEN